MPRKNMDEVSEYEGGGVMPNTVFPKGDEALNAHDKLRLDSITGQHQSAHVAPNPYHWYGGSRPEELSPLPTPRELFGDPGRYDEIPYD